MSHPDPQHDSWRIAPPPVSSVFTARTNASAASQGTALISFGFGVTSPARHICACACQKVGVASGTGGKRSYGASTQRSSSCSVGRPVPAVYRPRALKVSAGRLRHVGCRQRLFGLLRYYSRAA